MRNDTARFCDHVDFRLLPLRPRRPDYRSHQILRRHSLRRRPASRARRPVTRRCGLRPLSRPLPRDRAALFGPEGRIEFHPYDSDKAFARVTDGTDDLFFLDGPDIGDHRLAGAATLGPAVYFVSTAAMVHGPTPIQRLSDLAGKSICFYQGDNAHLNLEASMAARRLDFVRMGYMEYGEQIGRASCRERV